ncbi:MAG TPA: chitobiase/beta-hexosaminidase C-terminal domain-containing protein [Terracidiphilus sp.]|nr:chitobiase/beta-hexosaminidase C-terminal domain-containing protein [Terracidiphilus sp.]
MKTRLFAMLALAVSTIPVSAITVVTPSNGAVLTSPFKLVASTSTCGGVPAVSMGYSIDHNTAIIQSTSFSATVVASPGPHVLHVKCWGKQVNAQVLYNITIVAATTNISVASPANGATLNSPFTLVASSKTCASVPTVSMGYSIDSGTATIEPTSFTASVSASSGTHTLHVKCWGQNAADQVLLSIKVGSMPAAATPGFSLAPGQYTTKQYVSLSDQTAGSTIHYTLDGSGPSASSPVYGGPILVGNSMTVQALAVASGYATSGIARADYGIVTSKGPSIPSNAIKVAGVQLMPNWRVKHDPATPGTSTGVMTEVADPSLSGLAQRFDTSFTNGGGELYSLTYAKDAAPMNFVYDAEVYIEEGSKIMNLEMDNNQVIPNGDTVIFAFQCAGASNTWEYSSNAGTPSQPAVKWIRSSAPCNPQNWTANKWHHVQISYSRDNVGNVTYHSVWLDGVETQINKTVNSDFRLGWAAGVLIANFQIDGPTRTDGSATLYLDNFTMYRW